MERKDGLFPLDWDAKSRASCTWKSPLDEDFLLLDQLPYGLGSNDVGLDRGQLGQGRVVHFSRVGGKVLLIEPNLMYRSSAAAAEERLAVKQSFAESVLWGFPVEAEENGRLLVDATAFFLRDAHGVAERCRGLGRGTYKVDASRSALAMDNTKNFPKNTEVEAELTFTTDGVPKGEFVAEVTPDPHAITLREHTSLIELPGPGYTPRRNDPRSGYFSVNSRLLRAAGRAARPALHCAAPAGEARSQCGGQRAGRSRWFTTWIAARRSRSGRRWWRARAGGRRRLRLPDSRTRFGWRCCRRAPTPWTSATT
jgi:hypothetical protein